MLFDNVVAAQHQKDIEKWGHRPLATLMIATGEEFGEICRAYLEGNLDQMRVEVIHTAALLRELWVEV